jgi:hypothetical protein
LRQISFYASSATQAQGYIWAEVKRQLVSVIVLAVGVGWLSRWGIGGAAAGVLLSAACSTIMLQLLVRRVTALTWSDLFQPQLPGVLCAACAVLAAAAVKQLLFWQLGEPGALAVLAACGVAGAAGTLAFLLFAPFGAMQEVVKETLTDVGLTFVAARLPARPAASR